MRKIQQRCGDPGIQELTSSWSIIIHSASVSEFRPRENPLLSNSARHTPCIELAVGFCAAAEGSADFALTTIDQ
jgi:hypothetical protein